jgi:hypothetical protein
VGFASLLFFLSKIRARDCAQSIAQHCFYSSSQTGTQLAKPSLVQTKRGTDGKAYIHTTVIDEGRACNSLSVEIGNFIRRNRASQILFLRPV